MVIPLRDNAPTYEWPLMTIGLIGACCIVYLLQLAYPGGFAMSLMHWGEVPSRILAHQPVPGTSTSAWITLLSAMFMHANLGHLLGNMYALWLFGDNVEWVMGRFRFLLFYLACGLGASLATVYLGSQSNLPGIGASGAIAGVMAAYLITYPRARITSLIWIDPFTLFHAATGQCGFVIRNISSLWYIGSWILYQAVFSYFALSMAVRLNLGVYAHAAGALAGAVLIWVLRIPERVPGPEAPTTSDELTAPIIGDDGAADGGEQPVPALDDEVERLHKLGAWRKIPPPSFVDHRLEELRAAGQLETALNHCYEMLPIAEKACDQDQAEGYRAAITELRQELAAQGHSAAQWTEREQEDAETLARYRRLTEGSGDQ